MPDGGLVVGMVEFPSPSYDLPARRIHGGDMIVTICDSSVVVFCEAAVGGDGDVAAACMSRLRSCSGRARRRWRSAVVASCSCDVCGVGGSLAIVI